MARSSEKAHLDAVRLVNGGRFTPARRLLVAALPSAQEVNLRARIMATLGYVLSQTSGVDEAKRLVDDALRLPGLDAHTVAIVAGQAGAIAEQAGRLDEAERWLTRAVEAVGGRSAERANLLVNRSIVNMGRRALDAAAEDARAATRIFAELGLDVDRAQAVHNEGYVALLAGDLIAAMRMMGGARATLRQVSAVMAAQSDVDRAEVLHQAGLPREAEALLAGAAAVFGTHRLPRPRAEAELNLARSLLPREPARARAIATAAARRFRALGNDAGAARADAVRLRAELATDRITALGSRETVRRRPPSAGEVTATAAILDRHGFRSEAAAVRMSWLRWDARSAGAGSAAVVRVPATASMDVRLLAHEVRAARAAASGRHSRARAHAGAGLDALGQWQRSFGSLDLQTSVGMLGTGLIFTGLASAVGSGRPDVVFEWSERARHLSQQVVPLRPPPDPELAAELAELRMLRADGPDWLADPRAVLLRERARERQWSSTGAADVQSRASLGDLQGALGDDTALLAYVYSGERLSVLVVTRDRARLRGIAGWSSVRRMLPGLRADLDMSATIRDGALAGVVRRSLRDRLSALSAELVDAAAAETGTRRLVVTVPGVLTGIPWAMLPGMRGRVFTLATSATRWLRARSEPAGVGEGAAAGFAVGPRVARGAEEAESAAAAWTGSRTLRGERATVDAVTAMAADVDLLHVAAHGRHAVDNPLFSGLEMADGTLFGYDIDRMPRVPRTVVLSACEVGRSSVRWGEEAIGMTRIWLHAGTLTVVATPVMVADDEACELLSAMHESLAAGGGASEALAAASERTGIVAPFQAHGGGFR